MPRPSKLSSRPGVVIASLIAPTYDGGLAAYARSLAAEIGKSGTIGACYASIFARHPTLPASGQWAPPVQTLSNPRLWRFLQSMVFSRTASRPALYSALDTLLGCVLPNRRLEALFGRPDAIHFVGTGWDFLGARLLQYARCTRARFTVLPGVHPMSWGDDLIDVHLYKRADTVFCLSSSEASHLSKRGVAQNRLALCGIPPMCLPNGDGDRFRAVWGIENRPAVFFLGRRDEGKGYPALLKAWIDVIKLVPKAVLILSGPGGKDYESLLATLSVDTVRDLGVADEELSKQRTQN